MHAIAWLLVIWGSYQPDAHSIGSTVAIYTTERKCIAAGVDKTTSDPARRIGKYAVGTHYRCDSLPLDPPLTQLRDERDYRSVPKQRGPSRE